MIENPASAGFFIIPQITKGIKTLLTRLRDPISL